MYMAELLRPTDSLCRVAARLSRVHIMMLRVLSEINSRAGVIPRLQVCRANPTSTQRPICLTVPDWDFYDPETVQDPDPGPAWAAGHVDRIKLSRMCP